MHMTHDDVLKWKHEGKYYCLHVQNDASDAQNPVEDDPVVKLAFWGRHKDLGNELTTNVSSLEYWVRLCQENLKPQDFVRKIREGILPTISIPNNGEGTYVDAGGRKYPNVNLTVDGKEYKNVPPSAILDTIADELTVEQCQKLLVDDVFSLPVWIYEHSGITISCGERTHPYNDEWDSGQLGWALIDRETVETNWPDAGDWKTKAAEVIESVVEMYDQYLTEDIWRYTLYEADEIPEDGAEPAWNEIDSCSEFYGSDIVKSGMTEHVGRGVEEAIESDDVTYGTAKSRTVTIYTFGGV